MNSFGRLFRIQVFGESHGAGVGVIIDGCPAGLRIMESDLMLEINRRKSDGIGTTARTESDFPEIISGILNEKTTGSPIAIVFKNQDVQSEIYQTFREVPRPGHADFVVDRKFGGFNDIRGGGHFSGRLTLGLVAAGAIAKKLIEPTTINAKILEIGGETDFEEIIEKVRAEGDSIGGLIECRVQGVPVGLGEPFFDSVESLISHIVFSIPGIKAIEFGSGFQAAVMRGSAHNDLFIDKKGTTSTNNAGGINGGITNGNEIIFRVAVKPTSSISKSQRTLNFADEEPTDLSILGRHDACIALRAPVIVEAATAIVLADLFLLEQKFGRRME
ncbi:MAG: chorismate synthase [Candidatus Marinimicrobia bacterium CG08_land_8_20_14_0_20_45_22]|nr:MAG: chorismate synthase [Candidatus Marinimicrobia bacterium CG08_land_8_20_14_0_20_45_22]